MPLQLTIRKQLSHFTLDVSFSCKPGTLTAIVGPSGAGKSTLFRIICGLEQPDEGTITFSGTPWNDTGENIFLSSRKRHIGMVFQDYPLFPHFSVQTNITFSGADKGCAVNLLNKFGIAHLAGKKPSAISGGERQRVAFCQALACKPSLLLLDEPFSAMDQETRIALRRELLSLKGELNIPMIHITHDLKEAFCLADELFVMEEGKKSTQWLGRQQLSGTIPRCA